MLFVEVVIHAAFVQPIVADDGPLPGEPGRIQTVAEAEIIGQRDQRELLGHVAARVRHQPVGVLPENAHRLKIADGDEVACCVFEDGLERVTLKVHRCSGACGIGVRILRSREEAEDTLPRGRGVNGGRSGIDLNATLTFINTVEKGLVALHRAARAHAVLILAKHIARVTVQIVKKVVGVEIAVANLDPGAAVKLVAPLARHDLHLARPAPILGVGRRGHHAKFLRAVHAHQVAVQVK